MSCDARGPTSGKMGKSGGKWSGGSATTLRNQNSKLSSFKREMPAEGFVTGDWGNERLDYVSSAELGNGRKGAENAEEKRIHKICLREIVTAFRYLN